MATRGPGVIDAMTAPGSEIADWYGTHVAPGTSAETSLVVGETYSGATVRIGVHVQRAPEPGPVVLVTAAVHGDEINGTGAIRRIVADPPFTLRRGSLVCVPVVNPFGFERHSRYLPDRRDLNRCFPGDSGGSQARRLAHSVFTGLVGRADALIDLHTAAARRTNYPNVRADMSDAATARLARTFGAEIILASRGPDGSLRRAAVAAGKAAIVFEAGEGAKVEPAITEYAVRGIANCLAGMGMVDEAPERPAYRLELDLTTWLRADTGGFLRFHVAPGDTVNAGDVIATNTTLLGTEQGHIVAPRAGVVVGMATNPAVSPGTPVVHLAGTHGGELRRVERALEELDGADLEQRVRDDLATSVHVHDPPDMSEDAFEAGDEADPDVETDDGA